MIRRSVLCLLFVAAILPAALTRVEVLERSVILEGRPFGAAGSYERIVARAHFALDPKAPANREIRDLALAPVNADGLVEFHADLYLLKPTDPARANGTLFIEVPNRGGKGLLSRFQYARASLDPRTGEEFGADPWLMREGFTLAWLGWQWDVPQRDGLLRLHAPIATNGGVPITGLIRSEFVATSSATVMPLGDRDHIAHPALPDTPATLTARTAVDGPRRTIPPSAWRFNAARTAIEMNAGFEAGVLYEAVYQARDPRVAGVSLAAYRDLAAWLKYDGPADSPLIGEPRLIRRAIAFGISQSGRFLRTFLYYGFNASETGRPAYDALWADVAGAGRGSFNHRFAQASRDGYAYFNTLYPTDLFPFTDLPQTCPATGRRDGLIERTPPALRPKLIYTNGSAEYWSRAAALIHTTPDGRADTPLPENVRLYVLSGAQHGPGSWPPRRSGTRYLLNPLDHRPFQRAVLAATHAWVRDGVPPPDSVYPRLDRGELTERGGLRFSARDGVAVPFRPKATHPMDFGPGFPDRGIITREPPALGKPYRLLVPQAGANGIDAGGLRLPEVAEPLGIYTGWNLRAPETGAADELAGLSGSFLRFTAAEILARYPDREAYVEKVEAAARELERRRFLLPADRARIRQSAAAAWALAVGGELR
ncbi:MAG: hypothetical protein KJZ84_00270 [Bryobacteraceae bacterium]|nr:hypothetical protein [Bryobacteraceae bacterium]